MEVEELANAVTHGIGLALSLVGAVLLILAAVWTRDGWVIVNCCVYAAALNMPLCVLDSTAQRLVAPLDEGLGNYRPLLHLLAHRRDLYPCHSSQPARRVGLDALRHRVGLLFSGRTCQGVLVRTSKENLYSALHCHGSVDGDCLPAASFSGTSSRGALARTRRSSLYRGSWILRLAPTPL